MSEKNKSILRSLGILGYDSIESVIVAALATEMPLLLIGPHGTAKSLLLNWLAEALGMVHRHYNAAMINFDDLVGFPFPNESKTSLSYIPTAGSIWGAQSIFIDEISRTRIDMQNRLFPIIHEKVIQGIPLPDLRYRWAAMNPPNIDEEEDKSVWVYEGSQPLDIALADRFPFVVELPQFSTFTDDDKLNIICGKPEKEANNASSILNRRIDVTKSAFLKIKDDVTENIASYVHAIMPFLEKMKRPISPRRARMIHDVILSVIASEAAIGGADSKSCAFLGLSNALPHPAYGEKIDITQLLASHNHAWILAEIPPLDPRRLVFAEADPVKRVAIALAVDLDEIDLSNLIQDAYASLEDLEKICFAVRLYPVVSTTKNLTAVAFEMLANDWVAIENESLRKHEVSSGSKRHRQWQEIANWISKKNVTGGARKSMEECVLINIAIVAFEREIDFALNDLEKNFQKFSKIFPWC